MTKTEAYRVLEIGNGATDTQIKLAYRALARAFHPDRCHAPDASTRMAEINLAYETATSNEIMAKSIHQDYADLFGSALDDLKI